MVRRKSAPADVRPFAPAWLDKAGGQKGFASSYEARFTEVYRRNPAGQRSVRLLAGMLGSLTDNGDERLLALIKCGGLVETVTAQYRARSWEMGIVKGSNIVVGGAQVIGTQAAAIGSPSGGATTDDEARSSIGQIRDALRHHELIAS